jgi:YD repeat-containing protein
MRKRFCMLLHFVREVKPRMRYMTTFPPAISLKYYCVFVLALTFLCHKSATAQNANPDNQLKYIDILPPSPAVAKLGEFSRPDVGMSSGTAQFNLPLTQLSLPSFTVPIGLNYSSNGVKVDEISSRVGVGFQLEAGGAITRSVAGKGPDESTVYRTEPTSTSASSRDFHNYLRDVVESTGATGQFDSEPDIFNFSFCGMSGKFMLDRNDSILQIPKANFNIKADFSGTSWNFRLRDDKGNQFYFGGTGFVEKSRKSQSCAKPFGWFIPTAWFLQKIILYTGDVITFSYLPVNYTYDLGVNQTMYYQAAAQSQPRTQPDCLCPVAENSTCINYIEANTYYLTNIRTYRGHSISFTYDPRNDSGDVRLKSITMSYNSGLSESYQLEYDEIATTSFGPPGLAILTSQNQYRYFLKTIKKLPSDNGLAMDLYKLTYNDPAALPVRMSFAQDHWGHFNGKTNGSLVAKPSHPDMIAKFPGAVANRDVDTVFAKKGVLTRIQYPTGGYDSITYESNRHFSSKVLFAPASYVTGNVTGTGATTVVAANLSSFTIQAAQTVTIKVRVYNLTGQTPLAANTGHVSVGNGAGSGTFFGGNPGTPYTEYVEQHYWPAGTYTVSIDAAGSMVKTEVDVTYYPSQNISTNWAVGGVRVRDIKSVSYDGKVTGNRRFFYSTFDSFVSSTPQSSAVLNYNIEYYKYVSYDYYCLYQVGSISSCHLRECEYDNLFSSSLSTLFNAAGNSVSYSSVIESFDVSNGNGLIEHEYVVSSDLPGTVLLGNPVLGATPSNYSVYNHGKEKETTVYTKSASAYTALKRTNYYYIQSSSNYNDLSGYIVNKLYDQCSYGTQGSPVTEIEIAPYEATKYLVFSPWLVLDSVVVQEYAGANILRSSTKYLYDGAGSYKSLLPKQIDTKDSKGKLSSTFNYYSGMGSSIPGITTDGQDALMTDLNKKNAIGLLIYQTRTLAGAFNGSYRMLMSGSLSPTTSIYPKEVKTSIATGIEDSQFKILKYDLRGNILERQKDGVVFSYVWDYSYNYPIAEVKGALSNDIAATSFETDALGGWVANYTPRVFDSTALMAGGRRSNKWDGTAKGLTKSGLNAAKTYVLSYWYQNTDSHSILTTPSLAPLSTVITDGRGNWHCKTMRFTGITLLEVGGPLTTSLIDELRLYPEGAEMTTLTYSPLVGVTSVNDPNNNITYYEYDGFKRLIIVRDQKGNLLSTNQYNYYSPEN